MNSENLRLIKVATRIDFFTKAEKLHAEQARMQSDHKCHCNHSVSECKFPNCNASYTPKHLTSI